MSFNITNLTSGNLQIGSVAIPAGGSVFVATLPAQVFALFQQKIIDVHPNPLTSAYTGSNVSKGTLRLNNLSLAAGESFYVETLDADMWQAWKASKLAFSPDPTDDNGTTVNPPSTGVSVKPVYLDVVATASGAMSVYVTLTQAQITIGTQLSINGIKQAQSSYTVNSSGVYLPPSLNIITGDLVALVYHEIS